MNLPDYRNCNILVIGMGYVGLPLALEFAKNTKCLNNNKCVVRSVTGFDIDESRISNLKNGIDETNEVKKLELTNVLKKGSLELTNTIQNNKIFDFFIVTVPTPIDKYKNPDLKPLINASSLIGNLLKDKVFNTKPIIIFESTVFPGATEEICVPIIERESKLIFNENFYCGYSPERINPGDKEHRLTNIKKVVSGSTNEVAYIVDKLYKSIIKAGTFIAPSIKVAEAAKIIENTQRDLNIALVNELAILFKKMDIDTLDVLDAAKTKWNFLPFKPGLVGGHCIGVDPYYLTYKAKEIGFKPKVILAGRETNDNMAKWIFDIFLKEYKIRNNHKNKIKVLILGVTFKENCPDFRNTLVVEILKKFENINSEILIIDPYVNIKQFAKHYSYKIIKDIPYSEKFDAVICAVAHDKFISLKDYQWLDLLKENGFFLDIKGIIPRKLSPIRI